MSYYAPIFSTPVIAGWQGIFTSAQQADWRVTKENIQSDSWLQIEFSYNSQKNTGQSKKENLEVNQESLWVTLNRRFYEQAPPIYEPLPSYRPIHP